MKPFRLAACALIILVFSPIVFAEEKSPREEVNTAIDEAIRLLSEDNFKVFIQTFMPPETLKTVTQGKPEALDEMVRTIAKEKVEPMLKALKIAKTLKPTLENDGKKTVFTFAEPIDGHRSLTLIKIEKYWYIDD